MKDIFEKCGLYTEADNAKKAGVYPYFHTLQSRQDCEVVMEGKRRIMLGSNNYLGLTVNERVINAGAAAIKKYGSGCSGSRFLNGTLDLHVQLESALSEFLKKDTAAIFSTGFQTNLGVISALAGPHDYMLIDREDHASIYDACKLSFGKTLRYRHNDMDDLRRLIKTVPDHAGRIIVTDGVFSMSGDICNLPEIVTIAKEYGARVMVDDAHGLGVLGATGAGTAEYFGLESEVDLIMGTFSKSLASIGGFIAGKDYVVDYVRHFSRPFIFCASLPPASCATAIEALQILKEQPELVKRLNGLAMYMKEGLKKRNVKIAESEVPIVPIYTYDFATTLAVNKEIYERGVYVNPVIPPAAPEGQCMLRASIMASLTKELLDESMDIICGVLRDFNIK